MESSEENTYLTQINEIIDHIKDEKVNFLIIIY
jgi:hypothetical protein